MARGQTAARRAPLRPAPTVRPRRPRTARPPKASGCSCAAASFFRFRAHRQAGRTPADMEAAAPAGAGWRAEHGSQATRSPADRSCGRSARPHCRIRRSDIRPADQDSRFAAVPERRTAIARRRSEALAEAHSATGCSGQEEAAHSRRIRRTASALPAGGAPRSVHPACRPARSVPSAAACAGSHFAFAHLLSPSLLFVRPRYSTFLTNPSVHCRIAVFQTPQ